MTLPTSWFDVLIESINECGTFKPDDHAIKVNLATGVGAWVRLGDSAQDIRIWAALCAIKAALAAGANYVQLNGRLAYTSIEGDHFAGVLLAYIGWPPENIHKVMGASGCIQQGAAPDREKR